MYVKICIDGIKLKICVLNELYKIIYIMINIAQVNHTYKELNKKDSIKNLKYHYFSDVPILQVFLLLNCYTTLRVVN